MARRFQAGGDRGATRRSRPAGPAKGVGGAQALALLSASRCRYLQGAALHLFLRAMESCLRAHSPGLSPTARLGAVAAVHHRNFSAPAYNRSPEIPAPASTVWTWPRAVLHALPESRPSGEWPASPWEARLMAACPARPSRRSHLPPEPRCCNGKRTCHRLLRGSLRLLRWHSSRWYCTNSRAGGARRGHARARGPPATRARNRTRGGLQPPRFPVCPVASSRDTPPQQASRGVGSVFRREEGRGCQSRPECGGSYEGSSGLVGRQGRRGSQVALVVGDGPGGPVSV